LLQDCLVLETDRLIVVLFYQRNNPSYEFFPAKNINGYNGLKIPSQFFVDSKLTTSFAPPLLIVADKILFFLALPHNTFPHV